MIGFSKGGTVVVKSALRRYVEPLAGEDARFALLIAMYPWCGDLPLDFHAASGASLHMLLGEQDHYAGTESCKEFGEKFRAAGGNVTLKVFSGAQHDWDVPGFAHWSDAAGQNSSKCVYDEVSPGTWVERGSKITARGKHPADGEQWPKGSRVHCMTTAVCQVATARRSARSRCRTYAASSRERAFRQL